MADYYTSDYATCTKIPRFSTQDGVRVEFIDVPRNSRRLAVSGYKDDTDDTFIDLFTLKPDPDSQEISLFMTSQPYFSKVFTKVVGSSWRWRYVCLLDDSVFVTCCGDRIESYDTEHGRLVNQRSYKGEASCMTTRDGRIYVGLLSSKDVIVFDWRLNQINKITLKGLVFDYPEDIIVNNKKLFICTGYYRRALMYNINGDIEHECKKPNQQYRGAMGITVSEENGLIYILGWDDRGKCIIVYSLPRGHPFLPGNHSSLPVAHSSLLGGHSSLSGCHILALFDVSDDSYRIRINDNVNRLFVVTEETGEVYEYNIENIINLGNLLRLIGSLIDEDNCEKLLKYFKVPADKAKSIKKSDEPSESLFQHLRETGKLPPGDISILLKACNDKGISEVTEVWTNYQQFLSYQGQLLPYHLKELKKERLLLTEKLCEAEDERQQLTGRLEVTEEEMRQLKEKVETKDEEMQQLVRRLTAIESERQQLLNEREQLTDRLEAAEEEGKKSKGTVELTKIEKQKLDEKQQELDETKLSLSVAKDRLVKSQMKYAKESMALQEVLEQTREALNKKQRSSLGCGEDLEDHALSKEIDTSEISHESAALAADFGRLMVDVANDLTLDSTLQLASLFDLPLAESDMLRRISLVETPGVSLINFLKKRKIINMYDVTNLQKGLIHLHLYSTNQRYVVPYQQKVDPCQFEENRSPELADWLDERTKAPNAEEKSVPQESEEREKAEAEFKDDHDEKWLIEETEREMSRQRQNFERIQKRQPHIEHKINHEGGTITVAGVYLSIPPEAVSVDHIIAATVIHDSDIHLPGSARRRRMTPLIRLEPGLKLKKPARLTIPHSAIIPEPDRHSVIVFTGEPAQGKLQKDQIIWTEEKSLKWKLEHDDISLDINALSYIFVNLVSQAMEQKHMFRVVPFIEGILDTKDDVLITVCFCKDNYAEYKVLLEDHKSKLTLGHHTTFQVSRALNEDRDSVSHLDLVMLSQGGNYFLNKEDTKKFVDIDHLCAASRVNQQFRLKRVKDGDMVDGMVDVELKISQGENNQTTLILQSKVKNILLSPKSQGLLYRKFPKDLQQYENLKKTLSRLLSTHHCEKLAAFFNLTPAERDMILNDAKPGEVLIETLDERELIMPGKMIGLYEGLTASHLNRIARHVMNYIDESKKEKMVKGVVKQDERRKDKLEDLQNSDLTMTRNAKVLTEEGFKRLDVQHALKLSHGKLVLGRRLLLLAKDEHERLSLFPGSTLYREQYIDERGGDLIVAGIHLRVPTDALHTGRIVSLMVSADPTIKGPVSNKSLKLTQFVKFGPEDVTFHKPVTMIIPHCALITREQKGLDIYSGILRKDKTIQWNLEWEQFSCLMNNHHLEVKLQKPCLIGPHIPFLFKMRKQICVVPIMKRVSNVEDESTISLWFYNDDKLDYNSLINDEVYKTNDIIIDKPVSVFLESMSSTLFVNITTSTPQWSPFPETLDVDMSMLWLQNRHKVEFHLQNTGREDKVNLEIEARDETSKNLFSFNIQLKLRELLRSNQIRPPFQHELPESTVESFKNLRQRLSENLNADQSTQLANIFQLPEVMISSIKKERKPGFLLLKTLVENSLISPANISTLETALTDQGIEECVKIVRDFRKNNPVVEDTMC